MAEIFTPDKLIAGSYPIITESAIIGTDADILRGAILGKITASGKYIITDSGASDGSENPVAILLEDALAAAADVPNTPIALSGEFAEISLTVGNGVIATRKDALRALNIYFKATFPK